MLSLSDAITYCWWSLSESISISAALAILHCFVVSKNNVKKTALVALDINNVTDRVAEKSDLLKKLLLY